MQLHSHFSGPLRHNSDSSCQRTLRIVHISDTHNYAYQVPNGDILVHTGDVTDHGTDRELAGLRRWLGALPHKHKIVIGGNHEVGLDVKGRAYVEARLPPGVHYLQDSGVTLFGVKFYGTPWAFVKPEWGPDQAWPAAEEALRATKWAMIPDDTDILLTHTPPYNVFDLYPAGNEHWGCRSLRDAVIAKKIPFHFFGHVHYVTGIEDRRGEEGVVYSNAAMRIMGRASVFDLTVPATSKL